jgi:hypothetical protein
MAVMAATADAGLAARRPSRRTNPWYEREVSIVLREAGSNRVVYETRARNDGPYSSSAAILPVMFEAALQGFPNPPQGERRVNIELSTAKK